MKLTQKIAVSYIRSSLRLLAAVSTKKAAAKAFHLFCTPASRNLRELPPVFEEAEKLSVSFNSFTIAGYRWNKGGSRKVLIVHGFESSVINFDKYVKELVRKGYEVLAFDTPAHGRSSGKQVNALLYRDLIKFICEEYGPVESFMAHSLGGLALCLALAEMPHDDGARVVLIAPATETKTAIDQFFKFVRLTDKDVRNEFEQIILRLGNQPVAWYSIARALESIRAKILWFHDEEDRVTPLADAQKIKDTNHAEIRFVFTKGLGHSRIYRDPDVRKAVVDFL